MEALLRRRVPRDALIAGVKDRVEKAMSVSIQREIEKIERGLGYLATVEFDRAVRRSVRHGVGHHDVVPGHRDAAGHDSRRGRRRASRKPCSPPLSACLAAIPAVIAYNRFVNEVGRYANRLEAFADEFSAFLSRQLDERSR